MMNRRSFIRGAVIAASTPATIGALSMAITDMYREWLTIRHSPADLRTDDEMDVGLSRYETLQKAIIEAEPQSPRDVAIQFIVDTDDGLSYHSDIFEQRIRQLAAA